jgi:CheY-like chemotaxis protein
MIIPRMDNAELITAMAATLTLADVPMVIMSSLPEAEMASRCKGYRAFVRKPFRIAEVTRLVVEMLGERRMSTKISISASLCRPARDDRRTSGGGVLPLMSLLARLAACCRVAHRRLRPSVGACRCRAKIGVVSRPRVARSASSPASFRRSFPAGCRSKGQSTDCRRLTWNPPCSRSSLYRPDKIACAVDEVKIGSAV